MPAGAMRTLPVPAIHLAAGESRRIPLGQLASRIERSMEIGSSAEGLSLNWSAASRGGPGNLLMSTGSADARETYVFAVMPERAAPGIGMKLPYWSTAGDDDTMVSLWNQGGVAEDLVLRLTSADGQHAYKLPVHLDGGGSSMVDVKMLRQAGVPDADGHLLPEDAQFGSAMRQPSDDPCRARTG